MSNGTYTGYKLPAEHHSAQMDGCGLIDLCHRGFFNDFESTVNGLNVTIKGGLATVGSRTFEYSEKSFTFTPNKIISIVLEVNLYTPTNQIIFLQDSVTPNLRQDDFQINKLGIRQFLIYSGQTDETKLTLKDERIFKSSFLDHINNTINPHGASSEILANRIVVRTETGEILAADGTQKTSAVTVNQLDKYTSYLSLNVNNLSVPPKTTSDIPLKLDGENGHDYLTFNKNSIVVGKGIQSIQVSTILSIDYGSGASSENFTFVCLKNNTNYFSHTISKNTSVRKRTYSLGSSLINVNENDTITFKFESSIDTPTLIEDTSLITVMVLK